MDPKAMASPSTSPNSNSNSNSSSGRSSSSATSSSNKHSPPSQPPQPTLTITNTAYPTTFIQANTQSFKQVVQLLTGAAPESAPRKHGTVAPTNPIRPVSKPNKINKLYERRNSMKNLKLISPLIPSFTNIGREREEALSPSLLNFPSLQLLSPVRPSPIRGGEMPKLLPLFPLTSPRMESAREN